MYFLLEFTFLGTSSGIPTLQRNVSALAIRRAGQKPWCLIDCGEGTQQQLLRTPYSLRHLDTICITHVHGDHCYGVPGLLATTAMSGRSDPLKIVAPYGVKEFVLSTMQYTDMHMTYEIEFINSENLNKVIVDNHFDIQPYELSHRVPSYAYRFEEIVTETKLDVDKLVKDGIRQGPLWGKIVKERTVLLDNGSSINSEDYILKPRRPLCVIVGGDNDSPELLDKAAVDTDVLIHESTYCELIHRKLGPKSQHSDAVRVAKFAEDAGIENLILTHFSARYHNFDHSKRNSISDIERDAKKYYSRQLFLAKDFDQYILDKNGKLILVGGIDL